MERRSARLPRPRCPTDFPSLPPRRVRGQPPYPHLRVLQKGFLCVRAITEIAPDYVIVGSDYPHRDATWLPSLEAIEKQFRRIDATVRRKVLGNNMRGLYRLARVVYEV